MGDLRRNQPAITIDADSGAGDAFGRLRISEPETIFDSKQLYDKAPHIWDETTSGILATSVHTGTDSSVLMTVSGNNSEVIRQTRMRFNYQPGKSQLVLLTSCMCSIDGVIARKGYWNGTDGVYFEASGSNYSWNIMKDGVVTETASQSEWNLNTLPDLDPSKTNIAVIDLEWLGVGRVRTGFNINGETMYAHEFNHANNGNTSVYMRTANLPVRYQINSTGPQGQMQHICASVMSEGGTQRNGVIYSADNDITVVDAADKNDEYALLAVRLREDRLDTTVLLNYVDVITTSANANGHWSIRMNPDITGSFSGWTAVHPNASVEYAVGTGSQTVVSGIHMLTGYISNQGRSNQRALDSSIRLGAGIAGNSDRDIIILSVQSLANGSDFLGSLTWRELT